MILFVSVTDPSAVSLTKSIIGFVAIIGFAQQALFIPAVSSVFNVISRYKLANCHTAMVSREHSVIIQSQ